MRIAFAGLALLVIASFAAAPTRPSHDWLTWGGDPERTGWARDETAISKDTAAKLELKWRAKAEPEMIALAGAAATIADLVVRERAKYQ